MGYSLNLLTVASVFLVSLPVEAVVMDGLSVASEEVKIAQGEGKKQREDEALRLNELGLQQLNKGELKEALNNFEQALVIFIEIGERKSEGAVINNIGGVYRNLGEYPKALNYYQRSLAIDKEVGDKQGEGTTLSNIGGIYFHLGEYAKALD